MARRFASLVPFYEYERRGSLFDDPPAEIAVRCRAARAPSRFTESGSGDQPADAEVKDGISDLQFTDAYWVPSSTLASASEVGAFVQSRPG
jgi:hypothetical protein